MIARLPTWVASGRTAGQAMTEFAILAGLIIAALVGMQLYTKRSIQAVVKKASDEIGDQADGMRYESGDRQRGPFSEGATLARESAASTVVDQTITSGARPGGGYVRTAAPERSVTTGAVANRGPGVTAYSKVVVERSQ